LAGVIERALDLLLERTLSRRFGQTKRPRASRSASRKVAANAEEKPELELAHETTEQQLARAASSERRTGRRRIANATSRELAARDDLRCTFVGRGGQRCGATQFTQIHQQEPWARRGDDSLQNLRLLCASHNRLLAEQDFGREFIADRSGVRSAASEIAQSARRARRFAGGSCGNKSRGLNPSGPENNVGQAWLQRRTVRGRAGR
jgi:hypothetical protein